MILSLYSHLRNPPLVLSPKIVATFNAIRYSLDICDISYNRLIENLSELTEKTPIKAYDFPTIFLDVWSIINSSVTFRKIISREFELSDNEPFLKEISRAKSLRDSNQHIDERLFVDIPIYGALSWQKRYPPTNLSVLSAIYSGSITNKKELRFRISNQTKPELNEIIQKIELTGIIREGKRGDYTYREERVLINSIIKELIWWANHIDQQLNDQIKSSEKHLSDFVMKLQGSKF